MFKTGQLSRAFEIDRTSLNYYVRIGLLNPEILDNQYRTYSFSDLIALSYIRHYHGLGFNTREIRQLTREADHAKKLEFCEQAMQTLEDQVRLLQMKQCFLENFMKAVQFADAYQNQAILAETEAYYFIRKEELQDPVMKELYKLLPSNEFIAHCDQDFHVKLKSARPAQGLALKEEWVNRFQLTMPEGALYYPAEKKCLAIYHVEGKHFSFQLQQRMAELYTSMEVKGICLCREFVAYLLINDYSSDQESFDVFVYIPLEKLD